MPYQSTVHHRAPADSPAAVEPTPYDKRTYRLSRCEMLDQFGCLLAKDHCTPDALRRQIEDQLDCLTKEAVAADRTYSPARGRLVRTPAWQGQVSACRDCLNFIAGSESSRATLAVHIVSLLFAAWPPDYREYRRRCNPGAVEEPGLPAPRRCLKLRAWYRAVEALHAEVDRTQRAGMPPSQAQKTLEGLLLLAPGERMPQAE